MNTSNILLPYEYAAGLLDLNWQDVLFGIENRFFSDDAAIEHARAELSREEPPLQGIIDLAWLEKGESIHPHLEETAKAQSNRNVDRSKEKFLYLVLEWVYGQKGSCEDPLEIVECIYADFDYPSEIAKFVRYMPSEELLLGSVELNVQRLYRNWETYLEKQRQFWRK
jgi:hypothetical protein